MASFSKNEKSGLWSVRFRVTDEGETTHKRLSGFAYKREAREAYEKFMEQHKKRSDMVEAKDSHITFDTLIDLYLEHTKTRIEPSSYYDTAGKVNKHIRPFFANMYVDEVTPLDILEWQKRMDGYSHKTKTVVRSYLTAIYRFGERYYDVKNVMPKVENFRNLETKKEMLFWTKDEFKTFISCVDEYLYKVLFWTLYITGCRKGEVLALQWKDIEDNVIHVKNSITKKIEGKAWAKTKTKTKRNRDVDIPDFLFRRLQDLKEMQNGKPDDFVFSGDRPLPETTVTRRFKEAVEKAGVKKIRIHDLRHSCASLLISEGVSIVAVSNRLGHANTEQTLNTYSHLMPADTSKIIGVLDRLSV